MNQRTINLVLATIQVVICAVLVSAWQEKEKSKDWLLRGERLEIVDSHQNSRLTILTGEKTALVMRDPAGGVRLVQSSWRTGSEVLFIGNEGAKFQIHYSEEQGMKVRAYEDGKSVYLYPPDKKDDPNEREVPPVGLQIIDELKAR